MSGSLLLSATQRAIQRLRDHSRQCDSVEARRCLIATERWLVHMLLREEEREAGIPGASLP
ncbi:hypothetical protein J2847_002153 [Azospirillum agricola]|uniref:hypothetical protein n=1 Tax=Azospirillum agricola TaxID=1720247 RepID=UPI001AE41162|nr:hypothetical protein [Azospirillum agricola]MBP2228861.1 hypothetical protein [Azospirillum agricola]